MADAGSTISDVGEGAAGGALIGSVIPGVGTAIGAGIGGGLGLLDSLFGSGSDKATDRQALQDYINKMAGMQAPQGGPARFAQFSPYESQRAAYLNQLQDWMNGRGPSAAMAALKAGLTQCEANNASMAASASARGGGVNPYQNAMNLNALQQAQMTQQGAITRAQEEEAAAQMYGQNLQAATGQTQELSEFNAGQANQLNLANLQAKLQTLGITSSAQLQALLARLGSEPPSIGDQLLAGGASAFPMLGKLGGAGGGGGGGVQGTPTTSDGFYHGPNY